MSINFDEHITVNVADTAPETVVVETHTVQDVVVLEAGSAAAERIVVQDIGLRGPAGLAGEDGVSALELLGPDLTYTDGLITRIDYDNGEFKVLTYSPDETLLSVQLNVLGTVTTKTFNYTDGVFTSITQS